MTITLSDLWCSDDPTQTIKVSEMVSIFNGNAATTETAVNALFKNLLASESFQRAAAPKILGSDDAESRCTIVMPPGGVAVGSDLIVTESGYELSINNTTKWDSYIAPNDRAGRDIYLWMTPSGAVVISANSLCPAGFDFGTCRKIGGFHCLCADVGTIADHSLSGFVAGDILPQSMWDLIDRPTCSPAGMVKHPQLPWWCDIYLQSGTGKLTGSSYGDGFTVSRNWMDCIDDLAAVGKIMLSDKLFQTFAAGGNEETNVAGSVSPITCGGHSDTAGRRMISDVGCEDCAGVVSQWIDEQRSKISAIPDTGDPSFTWVNIPGDKGRMFLQGEESDVAVRAGGAWDYGANCGSRARHAYSARWFTDSSIGCRGCARSLRA